MKIKPKILIVDDDPLIQTMTRSALQRIQFHGFNLELLHALSAEEGRKLYSANPDIAVILLDVSMEYETAGLDFYQWVREHNHAGDELHSPFERPKFEQPIILRTSQSGSFSRATNHARRYPITEYREKMELADPRRLQNVLLSNLITFHVQKLCDEILDDDPRSGWQILAQIGQESGSYFFSEPMESSLQSKWPLNVPSAKILALSVNTLRRLRAVSEDKVYDTETKPAPVLVLEVEGSLAFLSSFQRNHPRREIIEAESRRVDVVYQADLQRLGWDYQAWWTFEAPEAAPGDYTPWCKIRRLSPPVSEVSKPLEHP